MAELLGDHPLLETLNRYFGSARNKNTTLRWIVRGGGSDLLGAIGRGELTPTHHALNQLPQTTAVRHFRSVLMDAGVLVRIDVRLVAYEKWVKEWLKHADTCPEIKQYVAWVRFRKLRRSSKRRPLSAAQVAHARAEATGLEHFEEWVRAHGSSVAFLTQADVDYYLTETGDSRTIRAFLTWTRRSLGWRTTAPYKVHPEPAASITSEFRETAARSVFMDDSAALDIRLIALIVIIFGQDASKVTNLPLSAVQEDGTVLRLGKSSLLLPRALQILVAHQIADAHRRGSSWLFPGRLPSAPRTGRPVMDYVRRQGVSVTSFKVAARMELSALMPPGITAEVLGLSISTTVRYSRLSGGSWADAPLVFSSNRPADS